MKHSDARIPDFQAPQLRSLYSSERRSVDAEQLASAELKFVQKNVYRSVIEGHSYYIKHFCEHRRRHQLQLKQGLKQHKAEQELATLKQLEKLGFSAIQPASVLLRTSPEGMQESILITEDYLAANPDTQLMSDYIAAHGPQTTLLLLEDTVNRLLQCGLIHLDIHTDNFFTDGKQVTLLDTEDLIFSRQHKYLIKMFSMLAKNLSRDQDKLKITPAQIQQFVDALITRESLNKKSIYRNIYRQHLVKSADLIFRFIKGKYGFKELKRRLQPPAALQFFR
ncbi:lipopolysaccharide kinase InaA family protein [Aliamphritea spongicola]|uniref:lipopolysaccharide kinase InaA family protein n=1 Tax=Aliamphritea spongicola TaxID=707589 RepID=UPI00196B57F3|nr:lipopolysaccharide kinase InaA family protein [Aliamphritea spongicola]MBN3562409.1 hypothetical protein [Aliamphritea spongicola]